MKNSRIEKVSIKGLGILSVIVVIGYIIILGCNMNDKVNFIYNYSQIISSITACINLGFIVYFFYNEKQDKLNSEKKNNKAHWFNEFIYEKNVNAILQFFNCSIDIVNDIHKIESEDNINEYRKQISGKFNQLSNEINNLNEQFTFFIQIVDKQLSEDLYKLLEKYEDELKENLSSVFSDRNRKCIEIVNSYKRQFIKLIYDYSISLY
ncbi:hypothetical protein FDB55_01980 [Clostridium botulinum]|uniref:hypothetical protein n=1 Tax=Clostridium botulinum TaxID=1491 RepID=UPI0013F0CC80|nr:hypothetical protein [Clostridium botulinum]MCS6110972.1 hypothetical protein [Clostridium botulinum]NFE10707.1 hypothetical protein [Clostridium botulinum]NFL42250.1 hypothetical protein [Clostridium botulinum]NFN20521.1 hypothetical protein [Clostridium botulinum]NFN41265.1 hypothetical protein [Clostridium botulinum]